MKIHRHHIFITALVLILVINGGLFYLINTMKKKRNLARQKLVELQQEAKDLDALSQQYDMISSKIKLLSIALPYNEEDFATFVQELTTIASLSGQQITIRSDNQPEVVKQKNGETHQVSVTAELVGSFEGLTDFFARLSQSPYYIVIHQMTINTANESVRCILKLSVFMW